MRWLELGFVAGALALALDAPRVEACGGPDMADLGALEPVESTLTRMVTPDAYDAEWGNAEREELRFLYPLKKEHAELEELWEFSHESKSSLPGPDVGALQTAIKSGDRAKAERAAKAIVDRVLDMPAAPAAEHAAALWNAVEYLELAPRLKGVPADVARDFFLGPMPPAGKLPKVLVAALDARAATPGPSAALVPSFDAKHPRAASLALFKLLADFRSKVPNGWGSVIQKQVPASTFKDLERELDGWLAKNKRHPARDFALLWKVRVRYFAGDADGAWQVLLDTYPRRLPRVAGEMRYLLLQGHYPSDRQIDGLASPELVAALAGEQTLTPTRWDKWWKLAESDPKRPWAANLEERLLCWAARHGSPGKLPASFPTSPRTPTQLWGKFYAAALLKSGRGDEAKRELESLKSDPERALLLAQYQIARGRADLAAEIGELGGDSRTYLIRVRTDDTGLARLAKRADELGRAARIELATRRARVGRWLDAAKLVEPDDAERAKRLRHVDAVVKQGKSGRLRLARYLDAHQDDLFQEPDRALYRAISYRYEGLATGGERHEIELALERSTPRWLAIESYVSWLDENPKDRHARGVLAEADGAYNELVNWAGGDYYFWGRFAKTEKTVRRLRELGKAARQRKP